MNTKQLRQLVISLLDDPDGISSHAYHNLVEFVNTDETNSCDDILQLVDACNDRYFLPEDHGIQA